MSGFALAAAALLYLGAAIDFAMKQQYGMAFAFFSYAMANVGFICAAR